MSVFASLAKGIVGATLDKVAPQVGMYFRERQEQEHKIEMEKLRGKQAWEEAKTRRAEASEGRDHEWELQSLILHSKGWKDEFVLAVVSIPAVLAFTPWFNWVTEGFNALSGTPIWYQVLLVAIYFAIYGIRYVRRDSLQKDLMTKIAEMEKDRDK